MTKIILKSGADASVIRRHPWVLARDIERTEGRAPSGVTATICDADGKDLAKASVSPESKIRARIWHWQPDQPLDHAWFKGAIRAANDRKLALGYGASATSAYRMVAAEGDGLPGVVIDNYGGSLVIQLTWAGAEKWRDAIIAAAVDATGAQHVYERSDAAVREVEGLGRFSDVVLGDAALGSRDNPLEIFEGDARFLVDVQTGHKTGFYLDQADNRALVAQLSAGKSVLNCFSYTGGFGISAAYGGATSVVNVDSSAPSLALGEQALGDHPSAANVEWLRADVKKAMRGFQDEGRSFDVVVVDPPKLAPNKPSARKALGVYGELNRRALALLAPGGMLATFSCSGAISADVFASMVTRAAGEAGVQIALVKKLSAGADHPVNPALDEGGYLKGLLVQKIG